MQCVSPSTADPQRFSFVYCFYLTFNVNQFTLNGMTLYEQYKHVVLSNLVPSHRLVPHTFPLLKCNFVRNRHCGIKRFHYRCVNPAERVVMWSPFHVKFCNSADDAIMTLLNAEITGGAIFAIDHYSFHQNVSVKCKEKVFNILLQL